MMKTSPTRRSFQLGLVGYPLGHSLSAHIHRAALEHLHLEGTYNCYEIPPSEDSPRHIQQLLERMREGLIQGLNVTLPYKTMLPDWVDETTLQARQVGAVNTIYQADKKIIGDNTDIQGFLTDFNRFLASSGRNADPGIALVIGGGGAARSVVFGLLQEGWEIIIATRKPEQAQTIAQKWSNWVHNKHSIRALHLSELKTRGLEAVTAVINTTPVGMWPDVESSPLPTNLSLPTQAIVYDLVYNPAETALVRIANRQGLPACTGGGMLVEQAALAFEKWTGYTAPRAAMHAAFRTAIQTFENQEHSTKA